MEKEWQRLDTARRAVKRSGFTADNHGQLFRAAHDIKGKAETFGFPLAAPVADSLCRLIEHTPEPERIPMALSTSMWTGSAPSCARMRAATPSAPRGAS